MRNVQKFDAGKLKVISLFNDVVLERDKQDPPDEFRYGVSKLTDWLFLGGEEDVCQVLGEIDIWLDFRHFGKWNRKIFLPDKVVLIRMPFEDGDVDKAKVILPMCKDLVLKARDQGKKVLLSCHAGVSRSALLALMILVDELGDPERAWFRLKEKRPHVEFHDNFLPIVKDIFKR